MSSDSLLPYKIHAWSSYSANYVPENILVNKPSQQSSRWSSETNFPPQFLTLKLQQPSLVNSITFGKYEKTHVCNLKKFKILGGLEENHMVELLQGGLQNDSNPETFSLKHQVNGQPFPSRYIKILPVLSWGTSFNFSIWHVQLNGTNDPVILQPCLQWYFKFREREAIRLCLKHFRQYNYTEAFHALQRKTEIQLEHPLLSQLHAVLVHDGDFGRTEEMIEKAVADNVFSGYISRQQYQPQWKQIFPKCTDSSIKWPGTRGGHQMCVDPIHNFLYLFGGWTGSEDLADFWKLDCGTLKWTLLSKNAELDGGPCARSCHKMCIDCMDERIYTLGRYLDSSKRSHCSMENDFFVYNIATGEWNLISKDVATVGGPRLIFDHQMSFDDKTKTIFVFGGRILTSPVRPSQSSLSSGDERPVPEFSGLYSYSVASNVWSLLREDSGNAGPQDLRSRIGHSMLLDTKQRKLYVFGGQRSKEYVNDFFYYDVDADEVTFLNDGTGSTPGLPPSGFTQRATIDSECGEIHMLSGLSKDREKREESMHNSFWVYVINESRWSCVYKNDVQPIAAPSTFFSLYTSTGNGDQCSSSQGMVQDHVEPHPRYAHQLVYDHIRKIHYMFGGNPGRTTQPKLRLDDFWCLKLTRPTKNDVLRNCRYHVRRQRLRELSSTDPMRALLYLQTQVSETIDHSCEEEAAGFRALASTLFGDSDIDDDVKNYVPQSNQPQSEHYSQRTALFDLLVRYFPDTMTQPKGNLLDLVSF